MNTLVIILALLTFFSTLIGGVVIVRFRNYLPFFFAFAAGSLVAVSFLDLLPESLDIARSINLPVRYIMIAVVFSFFFYSLLERFFLTHHLEETDDHEHIMGPIGAGSLVVHSFLDGAAIGSAFHVNASMGLIVALAVIFHDFTDGINTVTVMLKNKQQIRKTVTFLLFDALAPVAGVLATTAIIIPENILAIMLAIFVGEFLYIGASTLLPETRKNLSKGIIVAMGIGITLITVLTSLI
ncbi:MAG: ZIP family metal transporter [Candidatus Methanoperedens sp.]